MAHSPNAHKPNSAQKAMFGLSAHRYGTAPRPFPLSRLTRRFPVLEVARLRENSLTAAVEDTKLELLDTKILMVDQAAALLKGKGRGVRASVVALAIGAATAMTPAGAEPVAQDPVDRPEGEHKMN
jgi:hypothetical protein